MIRHILTGTIVLSYLILVSPLIADEKKETQVKEVSVKFLKAISEQDVDGVMKLVSVPWFEGDKVYKDLDELKTYIKNQLEKKPEKLPTEVAKIETWDAFRKEHLKEKADDEKLKSVEEALGKDGYIASLEIDGKVRPAILVSIKEGKAKVIGIVLSGSSSAKFPKKEK
jgi:hypothetical protein